MNQTDFAFIPGTKIACTLGCTVSCFGGSWLVIAIYDANCAGRIPLRVVNLDDGREAMPFTDEITVTRPAVRGWAK